MNEAKRKELTLKMARASGLVKLICGVANNAAWQVVLHAYSEVSGRAIDPKTGERKPAHPRYHHEVKRQFKMAIEAWHMYERHLLHATENRMFHVADMSEGVRKTYGDISDRDYYDFWASVGSPAYVKTMPLITSLWNKHRLSLQNHHIGNAGTVAWVLTAQAALELAEQLYEKAVRESVNGYGLQEWMVRNVFGQFSLKPVSCQWRKALTMLDPDVDFKLDPVEKRNIEIGLTQLCEAWLDPDLLFSSTMQSVEDYDEIFRTQGYQKKALRELADVRNETMEEMSNDETTAT